jgi:pyruvate,water dikinase
MRSKELIHWIEELDKKDNDLVGKKCANLGELSRIGLRVPPGFTISVHAWNRFVDLTGIAQEMRGIFDHARGELDLPVKGQKVSQRVRDLIEAQEIPDEVADPIRGCYARLCEKAGVRGVPVAVRSSGAISMPGAMETYLNVRGEADVVKKILRVWGSTYTYRAVLYRHNHNMSAEHAPIGIAVLQLVEAKAAGVLMTANPTSGDTGEMVVESNWGLGEGVVSGVINPDRFNVGKKDLTVTRVINKKLKKIVPAGDGTEMIDVPVELQELPSLTDDEVKQLVRDGLRIEEHFGGPTDVEWAYSAGSPFPENLYFLQARLMKPLPKYKDPIDKILDMMLGE